MNKYCLFSLMIVLLAVTIVGGVSNGFGASACNGSFSGIAGNASSGTTLYGTDCAGCHNPLSTSTKTGVSSSTIWSAINGGVSQMASLGSLTSLTCQNIADISAALQPSSANNMCTSFSYSAWSACTNGRQTRTVLSSYPAGCTGGTPVLSQSCSGSSGGAANGATIGVSGVVRDITTGAPVSGATITDGTHSTTSDSYGRYSVSTASGSTLTISKSGYLTTHQVATASTGLSIIKNWALTKSYGNQPIPAKNMSYVILAWNDLGMHCDQNDYSYFMVLPPYNTLHVQVFRRGGEGASIVTSGITVSYEFPKKANSTLHTNFWVYANSNGWFGSAPIPDNIGVTGTPLAGNMSVDPKGIGWEAVGIPITPYDDDGTWDPYGTAVITVKNSSGQVLQTANVVAPVSTEMMCSNCHGAGTASSMQLDILQKHDTHNGTTLAADQTRGIVHMCSECHEDNALGATGKAGVESLSLAMHNFHKDKMTSTPASSNTTPGCYNCHPGPKTQCLRGIMFRAGKTCTDCHGDMYGMTTDMQTGRMPWLQEPTCGGCHGATYAENSNTLFRNSVIMNAPEGMSGRIYCEACHNSTHGELTTANPADPTIPQQFQGDTYWIWNCNVCHSATQQNMHRGSGGGGTDTGGTVYDE
jgi:hypothetical protein